MCTSTGAKPARSKAAAISTWLLTPCSRRIATRGRAPFAMKGAAMSASASKVEPPGKARVILVEARVALLVGAGRVVTEPLHAPGRLRPGGAKLDAVRVDEHAARGREAEATARRDAPDAPRERAESVPGEHRLGARDIRIAQLQHRAELLAEERGDGLA